MSRIYTTKTPSLKATFADIRNIGAKNITLNGKNILDYIKDATPTVKHASDTRETVTENDLWGQYTEVLEDGTVIIHDDDVTNPNVDYSWNGAITKVEDNKAYVGDTLYANIQSEKIKNGQCMFFRGSNLTTFTSDLSSLTNGTYMFRMCSNLTTFTSDSSGSPVNLSSLTDGTYMFQKCSALTTFNSDLSSLTNGDHMFADCSNLTTFTSDLSSLINGSNMFNFSNLTNFTSDLSSLTNGSSMFINCSNLANFTSDLSSLSDGASMFSYCSNLTTFNSNLSSLTDSDHMFAGCSNLTNFTSDLSSLSNGYYMFYNCSNLTNFSSDLSSLTNGEHMFRGCSNLTSFNYDLPNLTYSRSMFQNCSKLTSFTSDLSGLIDGTMMFEYGCLNAVSVMYIADSIKDITAEKQLYIDGTIPYVTLSNGVYSATQGFMADGKYVYTYKKPQPYTTTISALNVGKLTLGIDVTNDTETIQQQLEDFAKKATYDSWEDLKQTFVDKGWTVSFQYGGTATKITYDLRNGEQIIPCQIFAKLVQVEDKDSAQYCTEDASTFYNIEWGHDVTDTSSYTQFDSLEDAMASWNVFPKENIISTEE